MKDLSGVPRQEQTSFFKSFDHVFCDVDGVLLLSDKAIPGAVDAINSLKQLGKTVTFVSNNNTKSADVYYNQLKSDGFDLSKDDLIQPIQAMIAYLKGVNFSKDIYLIGMAPLRDELEKAGFKVDQYVHNKLLSTSEYVKQSIEVNPNVGAVIMDIDVNMTSLMLQKAAIYLRKPEVLFITGGSDRRLLFGDDILIGPGCFHKMVEDMTGRKPQCLAKPGSAFNDFIKRKLQIEDPSRVLFIGDSVSEDMGCATDGGYKKLLVFSGLTKRDILTQWVFSEELKPDYYVDSLKNVQDLIVSENLLK